MSWFNKLLNNKTSFYQKESFLLVFMQKVIQKTTLIKNFNIYYLNHSS